MDGGIGIFLFRDDLWSWCSASIFRRPLADDFRCLFSVALREVQVGQVRRGPVDAQPPQSAEVWEESDFKEACLRPAQPRREKGPALLLGERTSRLRQELEELALSLDQAMPGAECLE